MISRFQFWLISTCKLLFNLNATSHHHQLSPLTIYSIQNENWSESSFFCKFCLGQVKVNFNYICVFISITNWLDIPEISEHPPKDHYRNTVGKVLGLWVVRGWVLNPIQGLTKYFSFRNASLEVVKSHLYSGNPFLIVKQQSVVELWTLMHQSRVLFRNGGESEVPGVNNQPYKQVCPEFDLNKGGGRPWSVSVI